MASGRVVGPLLIPSGMNKHLRLAKHTHATILATQTNLVGALGIHDAE